MLPMPRVKVCKIMFRAGKARKTSCSCSRTGRAKVFKWQMCDHSGDISCAAFWDDAETYNVMTLYNDIVGLCIVPERSASDVSRVVMIMIQLDRVYTITHASLQAKTPVSHGHVMTALDVAFAVRMVSLTAGNTLYCGAGGYSTRSCALLVSRGLSSARAA